MDQTISRVPAKFGYMNLPSALSELALPFNLEGEAAAPAIDLRGMQFGDPCATVALAAFGAHYKRKTKKRVELHGWLNDSYLSRVGLKEFAGYKDDYPFARDDKDRLTSLIEVASAGERARARADVLQVLGIRHEGAHRVIDYCLEEILRNVEDHAESPVNGIVQAQYYDQRDQVVLAIGDTGYGVLRNLRQRHQHIENDAEALQHAMKPGVSGRNVRKGTNAGLGLTVSSSLVTKMGGTFQIASGDAVLEVTERGTTVHKLRGTSWPGVLVAMCVPRDDSLDWEGTFTQVMSAL